MMRRALALAVMAVAYVSASPTVAAQPTLEYHVKAAVLLNFARFIEWPASAFDDEKTPIQVCVYGSNPFGDALAQTLAGEAVGTRGLVAREVRRAADADGCHLLFIPEGYERRAAAAMRRNQPTVTVGESRRFLDLGGAVNVVLDEGRVRFNVNLPPVEQRGIRISSKMLQLAEEVRK